MILYPRFSIILTKMLFSTPFSPSLVVIIAFATFLLTFAAFAPSTKNVGTSMITNQNPSTSSTDHKDYHYFGSSDHGEGRSMLGNDKTINEAMESGIKFYFQQLNPQVRSKFDLANPDTFRIPSVDEYNTNVTFPKGISVMLSCYDKDLFNLQHFLNQKCAKDPKCTSLFIAVSLWGTIGKMDFRKDGILLCACVLIEENAIPQCTYSDKPPCFTRVTKDLTLASDYGSVKEGSIREFGPATNIWQVTLVLKDWAKKNNLKITLPDGTLTS